MDAASPEGSVPTDPPPPEVPSAPARPRPPVAAFFVTVLVLQVAAGGAAQRASQAVGLAWSELAAFLLPALMAAAGSNLVPTRFLLLARRPTRAQVGLGALVGLAGFAAASGLVGLWSRLLPPEWVRSFDILARFQGSTLERAGLVAVAAGLAPLCEEIAFRGYLQSALRLRLRDGPAVAVGALLFAGMHLNPVSLPGLVLLGLLYGWLAARTGSIWPSAVAHAANNAVASLLALMATGPAASAASVPDMPSGPPSGPDMVGVAESAYPLSALALMGIGLAALPALRMAVRRAMPSPPGPLDAVTARDATRQLGQFGWRLVPDGLYVAAGAAWLVLAAMIARKARGG